MKRRKNALPTKTPTIAHPEPSSKRVALVTGSCGGIGSAIVRQFLAAGWSVIGVDRAGTIVQEVEGARFVHADLGRVTEVEKITRNLRKSETRLDAIVNNAAEQVVAPMEATESAAWDRSMAVNVRPAFLLASALADLMAATKGAIVNVASVHAIATSPGMAAYVASKGALVALTRAMALELAPRGVRVNAVLPGAIDTPMLAAGLKRSNTTLKTLAARHPLGRVGKPQDIAEAVLFLADNTRASFITGQTLTVDGGATARLSTE